MTSQLDDNSAIVPRRRDESDVGSPETHVGPTPSSAPWRVLARILDLDSRRSRPRVWRLLEFFSGLPPLSKQIAVSAAGATALILIGMWLGRITGDKPTDVPNWAGMPRASVTGVPPLPNAPAFDGASTATALETEISETAPGVSAATSSVNLPLGDGRRHGRQMSAPSQTPASIAPHRPSAAAPAEVTPSFEPQSPTGAQANESSEDLPTASPHAGANSAARLSAPAARRRMARRDNGRRGLQRSDPNRPDGSLQHQRPPKPEITGVHSYRPTEADHE